MFMAVEVPYRKQFRFVPRNIAWLLDLVLRRFPGAPTSAGLANKSGLRSAQLRVMPTIFMDQGARDVFHLISVRYVCHLVAPILKRVQKKYPFRNYTEKLWFHSRLV